MKLSKLDLSMSAAERHGYPAPSNGQQAQAISTQILSERFLAGFEAKAVDIRTVVQEVMDRRFGYDTHRGRMCPQTMKPNAMVWDGQPFIVTVPVSIFHLYKSVTKEAILDPNGNTCMAISQALKAAGIKHYFVRQLDSMGAGDQGIYFFIILQPVAALAAPARDAKLPGQVEFHPITDYPDKPMQWMVGHEGGGLQWRFLPDLNHMIYASAPRQGKTTAVTMALAALLFNNSAKQVQVIYFDPKGMDSVWLKGAPHLQSLIIGENRMEAIAECLEEQMEELGRRREIISPYAANLTEFNRMRPEAALPVRLVVWDDFTLSALTAGSDHRAFKSLAKLMTVGATFGIQVILTAHNPTAEIIKTYSRGLINTRFVLHIQEQYGFNNVTSGGTGEYKEWKTLVHGKGRMLVITETDDKPFLVQVPQSLVELRALARGEWGEAPDMGSPAPFVLPLTERELRLVVWSATNTPGVVNISELARAFEKPADGQEALTRDMVRTTVERLEKRGYIKSRGRGLPYAIEPKLGHLLEQLAEDDPQLAKVGA